MHFADTTTNEGCPIFRALCERWETSNSTTDALHRAPTSTLSSRAEQDRPLADDLAESRDPLSADAQQQSPGGKSVARANSRLSTPGTNSRASPFPPLKMTTLKRGNQQTDGIISGELSNGRIRPRNAVILRQRSPWQSQGLPTKDPCTLLTPPQTRDAPSFASFAKGGRRQTPQPTHSIVLQRQLCHPERRKIVRPRTILRSRGTCFLPTPDSNHSAASPSHGQIAGLSTPGTNSQASPFPPLKMTTLKRGNHQTDGLIFA
jgi:hypothetical protein